jgi:uncharacterized Zn finger protein (UPF0148 family)
VKNVEYTRTLLGRHRVAYDCPSCGERLRSPLADAGTTDHCPDCNAEFVVPGEVKLEQLRREKEKAEQPRREERERKKQLQLEKKQLKQQKQREERSAKAERRAAVCEREREAEREALIAAARKRRLQPVEDEDDVEDEVEVEVRHRGKMVGLLMVLAFLFWLTCGFFVIQPIGAIPDGVTIVYWRLDTKLPFVSSPDGLLVASGTGVSLLGRGVVLGAIAEPILERELFRFGYSRTLYLWSTDGKEYEK